MACVSDVQKYKELEGRNLFRGGILFPFQVCKAFGFLEKTPSITISNRSGLLSKESCSAGLSSITGSFNQVMPIKEIRLSPSIAEYTSSLPT